MGQGSYRIGAYLLATKLVQVVLSRLAGLQTVEYMQVRLGSLIMEGYDPLAPVPRYKQIAAIIKARIESGKLEPDRPIPSEAQIMGEFGVARATARHAVELLEEEGLVTKVPGLGTFVKRR
jgi:GntR family transcriptional regulator